MKNATSCFVLIVLAAVATFNLPAQEQNAPEEAIPVPIGTAERTEVHAQAVYGARIRPGEEFSIAAPVPGYVQNLSVRVGEEVRRGSQLAQLQRGQPGQQFRPATIISDFSGVVVAVSVRNGQYVGEGQEVVRLTDHTKPRLLAQVSDRDIADISVGDSVSVTVPGSGETTEGTVRSVFPGEPLEQGLFTVEITLARNPARIGTYVETTFAVRPFDGVVVPESAVVQRRDQTFLYVVTDGRATRRDIAIAGEYDGGMIAVSDGLAVGEAYIVAVRQGVRDGSAVVAEDAGTDEGSGNAG